MLVINLCGGLGNQMFQYAMYLKLKMLHPEVFLDDRWVNENIGRMGRCSVFDAFAVEGEIADYKKADRLADTSSSILSQVRRRLFGTKKTYYLEKESGIYDRNVLFLTNAYLEGYWQTERYFKDIRKTILEQFRIRQALEGANKKLLEQIQGTEYPVSIHVRMGDYGTPENRSIYGGICTEEYYKKAMSCISGKIENPTYFVFSNEPDQAKKLFPKEAQVVFTEGNDEGHAWADLELMRHCKAHIIANSSFSWWGAWLDEEEEKLVIAPKKWMNTKPMADICPEGWIRL